MSAPATTPNQRAIRRTLDGSYLTQVANHPEVRPRLGFTDAGLVDLTPLIGNADNLAFETEGGGFVFHRVAPSVFEVHSLFLPDARGGLSGLARAAVAEMFEATDAQAILTKVPDDNAPAARLSEVVGFREVSRAESAWAGATGQTGVSYRRLGLDAWIDQSADLGEPAATLPLSVSRAWEFLRRCARRANAGKAFPALCERTALTGFQPPELLSIQPFVIRFAGRVFDLSSPDQEIIPCL